MVTDDLPDEVIQGMVASGTCWVPTLELWHNVGPEPGAVAISNLRRFVAAGGAVALGTDYAGYDRPFELGMPISEIEWMLEAGMTPMQAIVAATRNAARVCNRGGDLGTVEAGRIADLLVIEGDPLQDIRALLDVRMVIHNGVKIR
jgi:imidazolonepropionase-like amidohydrolase